MISALIFSKDRAMQLDGTLRSFLRWSSETELGSLIVLYTTSDAGLRGQYHDLEIEYQDRVHFVEETDFRMQVLDLLGTARPANRRWSRGSRISRRTPASEEKISPQATPPTHMLFLVDDTLFVRPFSLRLAADALDRNQDALGFSFRLGSNTVNSYVLRRSQGVPPLEHLPNGVRRYRWTDADGDFAYPLELSSSFYRTETLLLLVPHLRFSDPNTLESQLSVNAKQFRRGFPFLLCWDSSVAFSAPVNRVQEVFENRSGGVPELSVSHLARLFEAGQRLDLGVLDGFVPTACHQEVSLSFKPLSGASHARSIS
jgi:hypothetical protein